MTILSRYKINFTHLRWPACVLSFSCLFFGILQFHYKLSSYLWGVRSIVSFSLRSHLFINTGNVWAVRWCLSPRSLFQSSQIWLNTRGSSLSGPRLNSPSHIFHKLCFYLSSTQHLGFFFFISMTIFFNLRGFPPPNLSFFFSFYSSTWGIWKFSG